jgi:CHAT domain-containing protein
MPAGTNVPIHRGALVNLSAVRELAPLPETADEVCEAAALFGSGEDDVFLGNRATESNIKRLSASGELANYRIIHFSTQSLLAGEGVVFGVSESSLVFTPPALATAEDDGILTESEIATLKLDADWVILAACNTAASGYGKDEVFSGLARAFFYAGAQSLLVSQWYVDSRATVALVTKAFASLSRNPSIGPSGAVRQSMLEMIDNGAPREAHPSVWAPFVVIGESG